MNEVINEKKNSNKKRQIKSFVLRQGRTTVAQEKALELKWNKWGLQQNHGLIDIDQIFKRKAPLILEIGYGMGLSLAQMAEESPDKNFIGIEVYRPGVGSLLNAIENKNLINIRTFNDDAVKVIKYCFSDNSIDRVQIYFPDPWHKQRHHKRRLIQTEFIKLIKRKLKTQGIIHIATDWQNYAEHIMTQMSQIIDLENCETKHQFSPRPNYRPITKFEQRGLNLGHKTWDMLFRKVENL